MTVLIRPATADDAEAICAIHNQGIVALCTRAGFTRVGIYREQGQLDGRWVDVLMMETLL